MITDNHLYDCKIITHTLHQDKRGYFVEQFQQSAYLTEFNFNLVQINQSSSCYGVIRGLHAQKAPYAQTKILQVLSGKIIDVIVDIRPQSTTFRQVMIVPMSDSTPQQLLIPKGCLHGYAVLSENAVIQYYVDEVYSPSHEIGVRYDDPELGVDWIIEEQNRILSAKDLALPSFRELIRKIT